MGISSLVRNVSELTDPRALPNLGLWLDSRYPNGIGSAMPFDGDPLATWTDLSGNAVHLSQASLAARPTWKSVRVNLLAFNEAYCSAISQTDGIWSYWGTKLSVVDSAEVPIPVGSKCVKGLPGSNNAVYFAGSHFGKAYGYPVSPGQTVYLRATVRHAASAPVQCILHTVFWNTAGNTSEGTSARTTIDPNTWVELATNGATIPSDIVAVGWYVSISVNDQISAGYISKAQMSIGQVSNPQWEPPLISPNNTPSVQFDGIDDLLIGASNKTLPGQEMTTYLVARGTSTATSSGYYGVYKWGATGINSRISVGTNVTGVGVHTRIDTGTDSSVTGTTNMTSTENTGHIFWAGNLHILSHTAGNGFVPQAYIDGSAIWANINVQNPGDGQPFGGWGPQLAGTLFPYSMYLILVFGQRHDDTTRKKVERMLSRWYGVTVS